MKRNENLNVEKLADLVLGTLDSLGDVDMGGVKLNNPTKELLDLGEMTMDIHVAMHPAAVAYYGALKKEAARSLASLKRSYDRWHNKMWTEAKVGACGGTAQYKPTMNDIEARLIVDHEKELEDWDTKLDNAQKHFDTLDSWFEAWRQKSFAMKDHVSIDDEERFTAGGGSIVSNHQSGHPIEDDFGKSKVQRVREIIRKKRETSGGVSV